MVLGRDIPLAVGGISGKVVQTVTFTSADTEVSITHYLSRKPIGYIVVNIDKDATIYDSGTAWTVDKIYLKSSADTTIASLIIF